MSHFAVLVIGPNPDTQLAPFSENTEAEEYITKKLTSKDINLFMDYKKPNKTNELSAYKSEYKNLSFEEYITKKLTSKDIKLFMDYYKKPNKTNELSAYKSEYKNLSFEELYKIKGKEWNKNSWKPVDNTWFEYSKYNPKAKHDWYELGGRWSGEIIPNDQDLKCNIPKKILDKIQTFAVLYQEQWYEQGQGWFGVSTDNEPNDTWFAKIQTMIKILPDNTLLSIYDCHI